MPVFRNRIAVEIARGVRAFLNVEAGITRGEKPTSTATPSGSQTRKLKQLRQRPAQRDEGPVRPKDANRRDLSKASTPVFFVVGLGKSGTTWLMKTLDAHPEILCKGEGRFFGRDWKKEILAEATQNRQPSSLYNALLDSEYLRLWVERSPWSRDGDANRHLKNLTRLATDYFLTEQLKKSGKKFVGDKTPLISMHIIKEIGEIYPEARVIHIVRDGRDRSVSAMHRSWRRARRGRLHSLTSEELARGENYTHNPQKVLGSDEEIFSEESIREAAQYWSSRVGKATEDGPASLGTNYMEVRYEDLLERPYEEVGQLLGFLGADASKEVVEHCVSSASFEKLSKGRERGEEDVDSFYRKGVAGDWKNYFTERDKLIFKEEAGELLIQLGYEKNNDW